MRKKYDLKENLLAALYVLEKTPVLLSRQRVIEILEDTSDFTYFDTASALEDLLQRNMAVEIQRESGKFMKIYVQGRQALSYFSCNIRASIRDAIDAYLEENKETLQRGEELRRYVLDLNGESVNVLRAYENHRLIMELVLPAVNRDTALEISARWDARAQEVYAAVYRILYAEPERTDTDK